MDASSKSTSNSPPRKAAEKRKAENSPDSPDSPESPAKIQRTELTENEKVIRGFLLALSAMTHYYARPGESFPFLKEHIWPEVPELAKILSGETKVPTFEHEKVEVPIAALSKACQGSEQGTVVLGEKHLVPQSFALVKYGDDLEAALERAVPARNKDGELTFVLPNDDPLRKMTNQVYYATPDSPALAHTPLFKDYRYETLEILAKAHRGESMNLSAEEIRAYVRSNLVRFDFGTLE